MRLKHQLTAGAATILLAGMVCCGAADAAGGVKVGVLTCHVSSGWGFIFGSSKDLHCNFSPSAGYGERYVGSISKFGVDIGYTGGGVIIWDVIAPSTTLRRGALTGDYAGATATAAAGVGVGANVLVGGLDRSISLQPVSVMGDTGLNVAAGIGAIHLRYIAPEGLPPRAMNEPPPGPPPDEGPPPGEAPPPPPPG